jgi:hypothetical protein
LFGDHDDAGAISALGMAMRANGIGWATTLELLPAEERRAICLMISEVLITKLADRGCGAEAQSDLAHLADVCAALLGDMASDPPNGAPSS